MQDPDTVHCPYLWPYLLLLYEVSLPLLTGIILLRQWLRTSEATVMEAIDLFLHPLRQQSKQTNKQIQFDSNPLEQYTDVNNRWTKTWVYVPRHQVNNLARCYC